jgi:hypothetical protein
MSFLAEEQRVTEFITDSVNNYSIAMVYTRGHLTEYDKVLLKVAKKPVPILYCTVST